MRLARPRGRSYFLCSKRSGVLALQNGDRAKRRDDRIEIVLRELCAGACGDVEEEAKLAVAVVENAHRDGAAARRIAELKSAVVAEDEGVRGRASFGSEGKLPLQKSTDTHGGTHRHERR